VLAAIGAVGLVCAGCGGRPAALRKAPPRACTAPADPFPTPTGWTWMSGADQAGQPGVYGTEGVPSAANSPGARTAASHWQDANGNFWLFGGLGIATGSSVGDLDDLWEYADSRWTWVGGTDRLNEPGIYGTRGVPSPSDLPGGRSATATWTDPEGNFWLFGGFGEDAAGNRGELDDLWKLSNGEWAWMGGPSVLSTFGGGYGNAGVYGTEGVAAPENWPGSRFDAVTWVDGSGNFWLFGGEGLDSTAKIGALNDLWKYSPASGMWTWMGGADVVDAAGVYGTRGVFAPGNVPSSRSLAAAWTDGTNLWLFGGNGSDVNGDQGDLDDLWEYSGGEWAWIGGSDLFHAPGFYGVQGLSGAANYPGARESALTWIGPDGSFWLFGGFGYSCVQGTVVYGDLDDVWRYSVSQWTWVGGPSYPGDPGVYGAEGATAPGDLAGGREEASGWFGSNAALWLFGGFDPYSPLPGAHSDLLNDLWRFQPPPEALPLGARAGGRSRRSPAARALAGFPALRRPRAVQRGPKK
jgi:N-acetylneuraminic acid mutarotase